MMTSTKSQPELYPFEILRTVNEVRKWVNRARSNQQTIGFVPTMGCLHEGHLQLVKHSLSSTHQTIVSIFINPTQFREGEDFNTYPKTIESDLNLLSKLSIKPDSISIPNVFDGTSSEFENLPQSTKSEEIDRRVSAVFLPTEQVIYPNGAKSTTIVDVQSLSNLLEGERRPGFFKGVATVVMKFFSMIEPNLAFFGQKDLQQAILLRRMISDLHLNYPQSLVIIPTVRMNSKLALSSRNGYLGQEELDRSICLFNALSTAASSTRALSNESTISFEELEIIAKETVEKSEGIKLEFFSINDPISFKTLDKIKPLQPIALSGSILVGDRPVRLIDNLVFHHNLNSGLKYDPSS